MKHMRQRRTDDLHPPLLMSEAAGNACSHIDGLDFAFENDKRTQQAVVLNHC